MAAARLSLLLIAWLVPACFQDEGGTGASGAGSATSTDAVTSTGAVTTTGAMTTTGGAATTTGQTTTGQTTTGSTSTTGPDSDSGLSTAIDPSTTDVGSCGDGVVNGGEVCDDGDGIDGNDCTSACAKAVCGDGIIHNGVEECDGGEDCDGSCMRMFLRVFVTAKTMTGNFGGLAAADELCSQSAAVAGLKGRFLAWLSVGATSAAARFTHSERPWYRLDKSLVAGNWQDLVDANLNHAISITEEITQLPTAGPCQCPVWTATNQAGNALDIDCAGWQSIDEIAIIGDCAAANTAWTWGCAEIPCAQQARLYCFEQGLAP